MINADYTRLLTGGGEYNNTQQCYAPSVSLAYRWETYFAMTYQVSTMTALQKRLLDYLAEQTALNGGIACTKKELASELKCNVKAIDRGITRLKNLELIEVVPQYLDNGGQLANVYRVFDAKENKVAGAR